MKGVPVAIRQVHAFAEFLVGVVAANRRRRTSKRPEVFRCARLFSSRCSGIVDSVNRYDVVAGPGNARSCAMPWHLCMLRASVPISE